MAELTYSNVHWGTGPKETRDHKIPHGGAAVPVAVVRSLSYCTVKDDHAAIWCHEFELEDGRGPHLLERSPNGRGEYSMGPRAPKSTIAIGRVVDLVLEDGTDEGRRVVTPGLWAATNRSGARLFLSSHHGPIHAIEHRHGPYVTTHGIEG